MIPAIDAASAGVAVVRLFRLAQLAFLAIAQLVGFVRGSCAHRDEPRVGAARQDKKYNAQRAT
jgi:hypothetical protein